MVSQVDVENRWHANRDRWVIDDLCRTSKSMVSGSGYMVLRSLGAQHLHFFIDMFHTHHGIPCHSAAPKIH